MSALPRHALLSIVLASGTALGAQLPPTNTTDFYVSDYVNDRVVVYDASGGYLRDFTAPGLNGPRGIVFMPGEGMYVAAQLTQAIFVFDAAEQVVTQFGSVELNGPTGMAIGPDGDELFVSSFSNARICVFDLDGTFLRSFTAPGFSTPNCVAFDSQGYIYAASAAAGRVFKFDPAETFLTSFTAPGPVTLSSPMGIARDADDVLYVAGGSSHNIVKFATDGTYLGVITHPDLTGPQGVAFDDRGHLFSSSFYQHKVVELLTDGTHVQTITAGSLNIPRSIAFARSDPGAPFCDDADGSLASCPCANPGAPETGCDNPQATGGVSLSLVAQELAPANGVTWSGAGFPAGGTPASIVIRSTGLDPSAPVVFGDGLRCVGTPLVRLAATFASGGTATHVHGHGAMAGSGDFYYQLWFRSTPAMFCSPDAFNLSSGRTLAW